MKVVRITKPEDFDSTLSETVKNQSGKIFIVLYGKYNLTTLIHRKTRTNHKSIMVP